MKEIDCDLDSKKLILRIRKPVNFVVLEGESKEFNWFALILPTGHAYTIMRGGLQLEGCSTRNRLLCGILFD